MSRYNLAVGDVRHVAIPGSAQFGAVVEGPFQAGTTHEEWLVVPVMEKGDDASAAADEVLLRDDATSKHYVAWAWCAQPIRTALLGDLHALLEPVELQAVLAAVSESEDGVASHDSRLWADGERHRQMTYWSAAAMEEPTILPKAVFSHDYLERQLDIYAAAGRGITIDVEDMARIEQMAQMFYAETFERGTAEHRVFVPVSPSSSHGETLTFGYGDWHSGRGFRTRAVQQVSGQPELQSVA